MNKDRLEEILSEPLWGEHLELLAPRVIETMERFDHHSVGGTMDLAAGTYDALWLLVNDKRPLGEALDLIPIGHPGADDVKTEIIRFWQTYDA